MLLSLTLRFVETFKLGLVKLPTPSQFQLILLGLRLRRLQRPTSASFYSSCVFASSYSFCFMLIMMLSEIRINQQLWWLMQYQSHYYLRARRCYSLVCGLSQISALSLKHVAGMHQSLCSFLRIIFGQRYSHLFGQICYHLWWLLRGHQAANLPRCSSSTLLQDA